MKNQNQIDGSRRLYTTRNNPGNSMKKNISMEVQKQVTIAGAFKMTEINQEIPSNGEKTRKTKRKLTLLKVANQSRVARKKIISVGSQTRA